jgi:DNA-binding transcriptional LysR family regulator
MALSRLRTAVGDPLFVRSPAGMTPTPRATRLVASVRPLLSEVQASLREDEFDERTTRTTFYVRDVGRRRDGVYSSPALSHPRAGAKREHAERSR